MTTMPRVQIESWLSEELPRHRASSAIFYIPDPQWSGQLRVALMPGVVNPEPMYGLVYPYTVRSRILSFPHQEVTLFSPRALDQRQPDQADPIVSALIAKNPLFGNFVRRESVNWSVRFQRTNPAGSPNGVLWVNFGAEMPFRETVAAELRPIFDRLIDSIPELTAELEASDPFPASALMRILDATGVMTSSDLRPEHYLTAILEATLDAVGIDYKGGKGLGSVFRYRARTKKLERVALLGDTFPGAQRVNDVAVGQGLISWVALRKRALLVLDLESSNFRKSGIYIPVAPNIASELVVPMLAGDQLIGVLNLESSVVPSPFTPGNVRAVWAAANQASIAYQIAQERDRTETFLQILQRASAPAPVVGSAWINAVAEPMDKLANLACDWLGADKGEIWHYGSDSSTIPTSVGSSYREMDRSILPRGRGGFTDWVRLTKNSVWLDNIVSADNFNSLVWHDDGWHPSVGATPLLPGTLNPADVNVGIRSLLGLPIVVGERCIGAVWLKFVHAFPPPPQSLMSTAFAFAAGAGIVIDVLEHQQDRTRQQGWRAVAMALAKRLFPTRALTGHPGVSGYVIYRPCDADLGGDFYAAEQVDDVHSIFLIGDAVAHGTEAALRMLPIISNFKLVSKDSRSSKNILQKLAPISDELELQSSAMCFILDRRRRLKGSGGMHLFVSNAGHPPLIVIRPTEGIIKHVPNIEQKENVANSGWIGLQLDIPLGEEHHTLEPGDYVIAFSDGVSEAGKYSNPVNLLGALGIASVASRVIGTGGTAQEVAESIVAAAVERDEGMPNDDVTVMVLRIETP